jgi:FAD/FMN-containing dehydrogenase
MGMDISLPRGELPAFRAEMVAWLAEHHPFFTLRDFGHWGDGGVHFNVTWDEATAPGDAAERAAAVQAHVYATVVGRGGSYSAEHGVGPHNQACYDRFTAAGVRRITAALKALLDPDGLLGRVTL